MADDRTLGEVSRQLDQLSTALGEVNKALSSGYVSKEINDQKLKSVDERLANINQRIDPLVGLPVALVKVESALMSLEAKVEGLLDSKKWLVRLVGGALVTAMVGLGVAVFKGNS